MIFKKYEFDSETIAKQRIAALLDEEGYTKHVVVELGYLWIEEPTYNEEGNELTSGVKSDKYSVDVLWHPDEVVTYEEQTIDEVTHNVATFTYPYGWSSKEIQYNNTWISENGAHTFYGYTFYDG